MTGSSRRRARTAQLGPAEARLVELFVGPDRGAGLAMDGHVDAAADFDYADDYEADDPALAGASAALSYSAGGPESDYAEHDHPARGHRHGGYSGDAGAGRDARVVSGATRGSADRRSASSVAPGAAPPRADHSAQHGLRARLSGLTGSGRWRVDPERRGALAVLAAILVAALAVGWQALSSRPHAEAISDATVATSLTAGTPNADHRADAAASGTGASGAGVPSTGASTPTVSAAAKVVVDVVGRVHRPGLVSLPAGARVADAIRSAGGALTGTNLSSVNLARVCVDGEQIAVGVAGAAAPGGSAAPSGTAVNGPGTPAALVDLNTASAEQLDALPGVGPVMAARIIAYRTDHGPFTAVSQLRQVSGIGDAKFADLSPLVTV